MVIILMGIARNGNEFKHVLDFHYYFGMQDQTLVIFMIEELYIFDENK